MYISAYIPKVAHFAISLSHQTVTSKNIIANTNCQNNTAKSFCVVGVDMVGPMNDPIRKAADKLIDNPEYAFNHGLVNRFLIIYFPFINF